jgi:hypothetical protein
MEVYTVLYRNDGFSLGQDIVLGNFKSYQMALDVANYYIEKELEHSESLLPLIQIIKSLVDSISIDNIRSWNVDEDNAIETFLDQFNSIFYDQPVNYRSLVSNIPEGIKLYTVLYRNNFSASESRLHSSMIGVFSTFESAKITLMEYFKKDSVKYTKVSVQIIENKVNNITPEIIKSWIIDEDEDLVPGEYIHKYFKIVFNKEMYADQFIKRLR